MEIEWFSRVIKKRLTIGGFNRMEWMYCLNAFY